MDDMVSKREIITLLSVVLHNANKMAERHVTQISMSQFIEFLQKLIDKINRMGETDGD